MKKIYSSALMMLVVLLLGTAGRAQTITNVSLIDSCTDVIMVATISAAGSNLSMMTYWGDGTSTNTVLQASQTTTWKQHQYTNVGTYTIKNVLSLNGTPIDSSISTYVSYCSYIYISKYLDNNTNCIYDNGESNVYYANDLEIDSAGIIIDTVTTFHSLYYKAKPGTVYKFRTLNLPPGVSATCPSNATLTITAPSTNNTISAALGLQCGSSSQFDLGVKLTGQFRPVATSRLIIHAYNLGCGAKNAVLTVQLSNKYVYKYASVTPANVSGNTITWNVNNLSITNNATIYLYADTATGANVQLNDTICNSATITPTSGDVNTINNALTQCDEVRASWDPNDKHVYPAGDIAQGTKLTYTINFENLGNDTAFNIYIMDTLSNRLDAGSLQVLTSSHAASHVILDGPGGQKIVRFDFKDIHLPDKNSPDFNKGFVQFSINVKNGLAPLTPISNRAGIYFDINPVVITNYAENRIKPVSINDVEISNQITVYPNPVTDVLTIQINNGGYDVLRLLNIMGQVVSQQNISGNTMNMNMANLPTGMYYLQLTGKDNTIMQKVEKH
jgi:hypothetical protein